MSPKERAKDLVSKMHLAIDSIGSITLTKHAERRIPDMAKSCALISVYEIIDNIDNMKLRFVDVSWNKEYWNEVKTEIEKL